MLDPNTLNEDELEQIRAWQLGVQLRSVVHTEGYQLLNGMLKDYVEGAAFSLIKLAPGDPTVPTAHAAASALRDLYNKFQQDIENAIIASESVPESLHQTLMAAPQAAQPTINRL